MIPPTPVDRVTLTVLVDNVAGWSTDWGRPSVRTPSQWISRDGDPRQIRGGLGLSFLVTVESDNHRESILYDTGPSPDLLRHNLSCLDIDLREVGTVVMSHGHWDHFGGLPLVLQSIGESGPEIHAHPRMFYRRSVRTKSHRRILPDVMQPEEIEQMGGRPVMSRGHRVVAGGMALVSGEIPRETDYERGFRGQEALIEGEWRDDSVVIDDQCLVINVAGLGLVVVSGCSHAGIVNMLRYAQKLTGVDRVYGVFGGLHLGSASEEVIRRTVRDLTEMGPQILGVGHCTGWRALTALYHSVPHAFAASSVGVRYEIGRR